MAPTPGGARRPAGRSDRAEIVVSAEHAGNRIPARWAATFAGRERLLESHRGWDPGSLELAQRCAEVLGVRPFVCRTSRLLIDLNRSLDNPEVFSKLARSLPPRERQLLIERVYRPHRSALTGRVERLLERQDRVVHLSWHTFTPVFRGHRRRNEFAVLFDPERAAEQALADEIGRRLEEVELLRRPLRVDQNEPYRGVDDGLTTSLRQRLGPRYLGIELELNQRFVRAGGSRWRAIARSVPRLVAEAARAVS
ncbi:MAG: N-formylglutamate amidohydrolase [Acidobacteria bacterium]|nr:MAG: N-formylglutamate amidohydrolase [Acidobacteriota bacterium]REK10564.1 MAG: N-formylglutamate amidohydrolase [Acidobacteriota bacterium]